VWVCVFDQEPIAIGGIAPENIEAASHQKTYATVYYGCCMLIGTDNILSEQCSGKREENDD